MQITHLLGTTLQVNQHINCVIWIPKFFTTGNYFLKTLGLGWFFTKDGYYVTYFRYTIPVKKYERKMYSKSNKFCDSDIGRITSVV